MELIINNKGSLTKNEVLCDVSPLEVFSFLKEQPYLWKCNVVPLFYYNHSILTISLLALGLRLGLGALAWLVTS